MHNYLKSNLLNVDFLTSPLVSDSLIILSENIIQHRPGQAKAWRRLRLFDVSDRRNHLVILRTITFYTNNGNLSLNIVRSTFWHLDKVYAFFIIRF